MLDLLFRILKWKTVRSVSYNTFKIKQIRIGAKDGKNNFWKISDCQIERMLQVKVSLKFGYVSARGNICNPLVKPTCDLTKQEKFQNSFKVSNLLGRELAHRASPQNGIDQPQPNRDGTEANSGTLETHNYQHRCEKTKRRRKTRSSVKNSQLETMDRGSRTSKSTR